MTAPLASKRSWLRLVGFIPFAFLSMVVTMVVIAIVAILIPALGHRIETLGEGMDDTPLRLVEDSYQTLIFGVSVGCIALSLLAAAAMTWRRPFADFLWPGRRFDPMLFGVGFLLIIAVSAMWVPVSLATGSEWRPPVFDPYYVAHTRLLYAAVMVGAVLAGAAAEEVMFRGVLLRVTGLLTRHALPLCLVNGLLFSAIHLDPDPVAFVARTISGMGWTWAALRLGGLEFAIGGHFANNFFIGVFWSPFSTEAMQSQPSPWTDLIPQLITTAIVVIAVEWLARRRGVQPDTLSARSAA
jgi:hypothetical protein